MFPLNLNVAFGEIAMFTKFLVDTIHVPSHFSGVFVDPLYAFAGELQFQCFSDRYE